MPTITLNKVTCVDPTSDPGSDEIYFRIRDHGRLGVGTTKVIEDLNLGDIREIFGETFRFGTTTRIELFEQDPFARDDLIGEQFASAAPGKHKDEFILRNDDGDILAHYVLDYTVALDNTVIA